MMVPLRVAFLAGLLLTAPGTGQAESVPSVQTIHFVCNGYGPCFENGALDRLDAVKRDVDRMHRDDDDED